MHLHFWPPLALFPTASARVSCVGVGVYVGLWCGVSVSVSVRVDS